ncbi:NAD(P)/FAD-dependent oxidoreductase [Robbsia sp. KACC 23696]|uniref:NAD(P)/FAD-dependent oxidoreductase n=1 Tax=Robbsia sp. KACC 23696 TaxID=3149231 RepID=UPI00325BDA66
MPATAKTPYDVMIIGGGYAGIAAALQLARAHCRLLIFDAGRPRDRFSTASHDFIGLDERPTAASAAEAKARLLRYPNVDWLAAFATYAYVGEDGLFEALDVNTNRYKARRIVLASGLVDALPKIPGLAERWGKTVSLSPYYTAYALDKAPLGVLAFGEGVFEEALLLADWGPVTLFTDAKIVLRSEQTHALTARGVLIEQERVVGLQGNGANVQLADGRTVPLAMLFMAPPSRLGSPIARQLGCDISPGGAGEYVLTDASQQTSVRGVFACGDIARVSYAVSLAVGDGTAAGIAVRRSLKLTNLG